MQTPPACAAASADAAEPIAGTATASTERWLVVENCDPWPRKGLPASMRADLRAAVDAAAAAVPGTRIVLARGTSGVQETGIRIWIARANAHERAVRLVHLRADMPAEDLDLEARLRGLRTDGEPVEHLLLVCTHGQRDRCCARLGMPVYKALCSVAPGATLRASHLGGHRFAATVVALPLGAHFGRVTKTDAADLIAAIRSGDRGPARWYRGRTFESRPAQAALCHLHDALDEPRLDALTVEGVEQDGDGSATVRIRHGVSTHRVRVSLAAHPRPLPKSCGSEVAPIPGWRVCTG